MATAFCQYMEHSGRCVARLAERTGLDELWLTRLLNGHVEASEERKRAICMALGAENVKSLFPEPKKKKAAKKKRPPKKKVI